MIDAEEQIAYERAIDEWAQTWSSHDVESLLALHTDDAVVEDVARGAVFHGKDELRAFAEAFVTGDRVNDRYSPTSRFARLRWPALVRTS
ncbi:MAG: nuclear transport factor 2 family protein [Chloroflexi bacterium]|nr:nuclear transport factor 2 family protein [Chloroflexota bacterium]